MNTDTPEDKGPVRPQVIDLEAEEIRAEPEEPLAAAPETPRHEQSPPPPPPPPPRSRKGHGAAAWIIAALILGLLAGGWLYRDVLSAYFPSNEVTALKSRLEALEINTASLGEQLAAAKDEAARAAQAAAAAGEAAATAQNQASAAAEGLGALGTRLDETAQRAAAADEALAAARADLDSFRTAISSAPAIASGGGADPAALAAFAQRLDALEKDVASLKAAPAASGQAEQAAALSQALSDLKAKLAAGTGYGAEYERIARMVPAAAGLEVAGAHASEGLPAAAGLAAELRAAIPGLPQPAPPPAEDDSYLGTVMKSLSGIVTIRPIGETDWPAVAEKAASLAEAGDLTQAISVIEAAEGDKPAALVQWRERAAARLQLEAALAQVSEAVLRQLSAMGGVGP